jgi:hypothetical protein
MAPLLLVQLFALLKDADVREPLSTANMSAAFQQCMTSRSAL